MLSELLGCVKHLNLSFKELLDMPTYMRKMMIQLHNKDTEKKNEALKSQHKK